MPTTDAVLIRTQNTPTHTRGVFCICGEVFFTIEPPWRNNRRNESCIPPGEYTCVFLPRSASGKYRDVFHVTNVPDRSGVLIHNGNLAKHSKGCIIIGSAPGVLGGVEAVLLSRKALRQLGRVTSRRPFKLRIINHD